MLLKFWCSVGGLIWHYSTYMIKLCYDWKFEILYMVVVHNNFKFLTVQCKKNIIFYFYFCYFSCPWIRIRIPNPDPDPETQLNPHPDPKHCWYHPVIKLTNYFCPLFQLRLQPQLYFHLK